MNKSKASLSFWRTINAELAPNIEDSEKEAIDSRAQSDRRTDDSGGKG
ncbi:hypothetical protein GCM10027217_14030 [Pseudomaricurvus hydrocarbonicus]